MGGPRYAHHVCGDRQPGEDRARAGVARAGRQAGGGPRVPDGALRQSAPRHGGRSGHPRQGLRRARRPGRRPAPRTGERERDYGRGPDRRRCAGRRDRAGRRGGTGTLNRPQRVRHRLVHLLGFTPMAHRPPLPRRWWIYCAIAYLSPSLVLALVPAHEVPYRDIVWLLTLVPAYLLSLHYGMRGAVAGLVMGTVLFTTIQLLVAMQLDAEDWRITVPIYTAYGTIAISVGWLSQQLHEFYGRAIEGERVAVIRQLAVTMRHDVNNALAAILAEGQLLEHDAVLTHPEDKQSLQNILTMARRIQHCIDTLVNVTHAPVTEYVEGVPMIDLQNVKSTHQRSKD